MTRIPNDNQCMSMPDNHQRRFGTKRMAIKGHDSLIRPFAFLKHSSTSTGHDAGDTLSTSQAAISVLLLDRCLMLMSPQWSAVAHNPQAQIGTRTTSWHPSHSQRPKRILVG